MKRLLSILTFALLVCSCSISRKTAVTQYPEIGSEFKHEGILESAFCPASIPGPHERRVYVYLPSDYYYNTEDYPVLYLLHGARGDEASWITQGNLLPTIDSLKNCGKIADMIVVLPNMNSYDSEEDYGKSRHKGALESFFEVDGAIETAFVKDIVGAIDSLYRTRAVKEGRAIAGLSLGGMQAIHISASNPDTFAYVGMLSSALHSFVRKGDYSSFYKNLESKQVAQFKNPPLLYAIYIGKKDIYKGTMEKYCKYLDENGYKHTFQISGGGHQWPEWTNYISSFMTEIF